MLRYITKKAVLTLCFFIATTAFAHVYSQELTLSGTQHRETLQSNPKQSCTPVKLTGKMVISNVEGDCKGFWIQKGSITVFKFENKEDAIGTKLAPGVYYVYPYLEKQKKDANVTITIKRKINTN